MFSVLKYLTIALIASAVYAQDPAEFDEELCIGLDDGAIVAIDGSCDNYYYCSEQIAYLSKCSDFGDEYQFDININDCNYADEVNCVEDLPEPEPIDPPTLPPTPPPTAAPQTTEATTIAVTTTESTEITDVTCPTNRPGEILFFESLNCTEYYICANGVKLTMKCMDGFVWNPQENLCDHPVFNPRCSGASYDGSTSRIVCNRHGQYTTAYPLDCSKFVFCAEGIPMVQICPIGTAWFIDRCIDRRFASCPDATRRLF